MKNVRFHRIENAHFFHYELMFPLENQIGFLFHVPAPHPYVTQPDQ